MLPDLVADELRLCPRRWMFRFDDQRPFAYVQGRDFVHTADHMVWAHVSDGDLRSARSGRRIAYQVGDVLYDAETRAPVHYPSGDLALPGTPFGEMRAVRATHDANPHRTANLRERR
jgi:hypothetical protein